MNKDIQKEGERQYLFAEGDRHICRDEEMRARTAMSENSWQPCSGMTRTQAKSSWGSLDLAGTCEGRRSRRHQEQEQQDHEGARSRSEYNGCGEGNHHSNHTPYNLLLTWPRELGLDCEAFPAQGEEQAEISSSRWWPKQPCKLTRRILVTTLGLVRGRPVGSGRRKSTKNYFEK